MTQPDGTGAAARPAPRAAYERWLDTLARAGWAPDPGTELVPLPAALGRVTAAPVTARWPSPRADCAAMDGIAVRAADLTGTGTDHANRDGESQDSASRDTAGRDSGAGEVRLPAGQFAWIDTGDPMPPGTDTVVVRERLLPQEDGAVVIAADDGGQRGHGHGHGHGPGRRLGRGRNVRPAGEDFTTGEVLVPAGTRLRPVDLAAAGAGGHTRVSVTRRPVVAIIPTGDEIRPVGTVPRSGDILDTNSLMLAGRCRLAGAEPVVGAIVPDDPDALAAAVLHAAGTADLVLVIAGSSRGRGDHAASVIGQVGGVAVAGVAIRPGHPAILGHAKRPAAGRGAGGRSGTAPVIGLPGYPLATAVIFESFAVPLLAALQGCAAGPATCASTGTVTARLGGDWSSRANVEDWVLVRLAGGPPGEPPLATPSRHGSGSVSALARADAWWAIPAGQGDLAAGTVIQVRPLAGGAWAPPPGPGPADAYS